MTDYQIDRKKLALILQDTLSKKKISVLDAARELSLNEKNLAKWLLNQAKALPNEDELSKIIAFCNITKEEIMKPETKISKEKEILKEREIIINGYKYYIYNSNRNFKLDYILLLVTSIIVSLIIIIQSTLTIIGENYPSVPAILNYLIALLFLSTIISISKIKEKTDILTFNKSLLAHLIHLDKVQINSLKYSFKYNVLVILNILFGITDLFNLYTSENTKDTLYPIIITVLLILSFIISLIYLFCMNNFVKAFDRLYIAYKDENRTYSLKNLKISPIKKNNINKK